MSVNNPTVVASDIITDVEARLGSPSIDTNTYLPWISYAHLKTYAALMECGREVKERLFGAYATFALVSGTAEYSLASKLPRYAGYIKAEIVYGLTTDQRSGLTLLPSIAHWGNMGNVSTSYRSKTDALFYIFGDTLGFIPTPDGGNAYFWYIQGPYQINAANDPIAVPYRFMYPIVTYVQAKAIEKTNENYFESDLIERKFESALESMQLSATSEINESDGTNSIEVSTDDPIYENPFGSY